MQFKILTWLLLVAAGSPLAVKAADAPAGGAKPANPLAGLFADPVLARAKGAEVKRSELDEAFIAYKANLALRGQAIPEPLRAAQEARLLDLLLVNRLMMVRATEADRTRAKEIGVKLLADAKREFPTDEAFQRRIKSLGLTAERFTQQAQDEALKQAVLERELKSSITIADAQVREFYTNGTDVLVKNLETVIEKMAKDPKVSPGQLADARKQVTAVRQNNLTRLEQPEKVRLLHIFMATRNRDTDEDLPEDVRRLKRQKLEQLLIRAREGEDFAKMVMDFSEEQNLKQSKGEYTITREDAFSLEFKSAAFTLRPGQLSDLVTTPFGYHVIKLLDKLPPQKTPLDKVADDIKEFLRAQELQKHIPAFFDRLKKEAGAEILDPQFKLLLDQEAATAPPAN